jgi:serine protease Do
MNSRLYSRCARTPWWPVTACAILLAFTGCSRGFSAPSGHAGAPAASDPPASTGMLAAEAAQPSASPPGDVVTRALPDFSQLVERYGPAVVNVEVVEKAQNTGGIPGLSPNDPFYDFFRRFGIPTPDQGQQGHQAPVRGAGSGFIVNSDGYILTNTHVVANAEEVTVRLTDRREFPAKVIGADDRTDVAVIKINGTNLPIVKLGDPSRIKPGQWVLALRLREQRHRGHHQRHRTLGAG